MPRTPGPARGATPATAALVAAGVVFETVAYPHDPRTAGYATEAAEALGLSPDQVFKTLVVSLDTRLCVGIVPASGTLDVKALALALGGRRAQLADQREAERKTGYVVGGISPFGQKARLPTALDVSAIALDVMFVSGGRRGLEIRIDPADLVRVLDAVVAPIARS